MKTDPENIKVLLERINRNDQKAFSVLFQMFYKRLLNFAFQYVKAKEIAEEIVSDVFIKLWNKREEVAKIENAEAYLFIAVKNASLNYLEKFSLFQVCQIPESFRSELVNLDNPQKALEWKELLFKMDEAISTLPSECQKVFRLSKEEGFKAKEVAEILNISHRTVETQLYRAVRKIDEILSNYLQRSFKKKDIRD
jgi:RNA polymerase sigma-70 factor (family 1)